MVGWREAGGLIRQGNGTRQGLEVGECDLVFAKEKGVCGFMGVICDTEEVLSPVLPEGGLASHPAPLTELAVSIHQEPAGLSLPCVTQEKEPRSGTIHFKRPFSPWGRLCPSQCLCELTFPLAPGGGSALCLR